MKCVFDTCSEAVAYACENKSFGIYHSTQSNATPEIHIHECCEVLFCLSGAKHFLIGGQLYDVRDNDIFVLNQFEAHKITYEQGAKIERYVIQISPELLNASSTDATNLGDCFYPHKHGFDHRVNLSPEKAAKFREKLDSLCKDYGYGDDLLKKCIFTELLVELNQAFCQEERVEIDTQGKGAVKLAIDYINNNYDMPLTLESVAKNSFVSVNHLCRLFLEHCGTTVAKYITSKRITEAKKMLLSGKSVTDVAMKCGFGDYSGFIRVFKKNVGITPGKYRG